MQGACRAALSPGSLTASKEEGSDPSEGQPRRTHVPCPSQGGCWARTAPSNTAHHGEHHGEGAVLQKVPKAIAVGLSHAGGAERSRDRELHWSAGAQPSWQVQPSRLPAQPAASVSPACPERSSQAGSTLCPPHSLATGPYRCRRGEVCSDT